MLYQLINPAHEYDEKTERNKISMPNSRVDASFKIKFHLEKTNDDFKKNEESLLKGYPDEIIPNLFLGNLSHGEYFLNEMINKKNTVTVLKCTTLSADLPMAAEVEKQTIENNFKVLKIEDTLSERISNHFNDAFDFIKTSLNKDKKVLVYCGAGVSRAPTIVIAYLMKKYHLKYEEAFNHTKRKRACIDPNKNFIVQLKEYEIRLAREKSSFRRN